MPPSRRPSDPICQDTGIAICFVELGSNVLVDGGTLADALSEGTRLGYRDGYLRKPMVADPLFDRTNTGDNTPVEAHIEMVAGDALRIVLLPKGGGAENMSRLAMLKPSDGAAGVADFVADAVAQGGGGRVRPSSWAWASAARPTPPCPLCQARAAAARPARQTLTPATPASKPTYSRNQCVGPWVPRDWEVP